MAAVGKNMLAVHPEVARRTLKLVDEQCSLYYIVIGSVYNLAQSSMVDAVAEMSADSRLWRHEVKRNARLALAAYDSWNQKMRLKLADRYQLWLDVSDSVADALRDDVRKLRWSFDALLMKHRVERHALCAAVLTAVTMADIATLTFARFLNDGSRKAGVDMTAIFSRESSFTPCAAAWEKVAQAVLRRSGGNVDANADPNCRLAADIISRRLSRMDVYEQACGYGAELNMDVVGQHLQQ